MTNYLLNPYIYKTTNIKTQKSNTKSVSQSTRAIFHYINNHIQHMATYTLNMNIINFLQQSTRWSTGRPAQRSSLPPPPARREKLAPTDGGGVEGAALARMGGAWWWASLLANGWTYGRRQDGRTGQRRPGWMHRRRAGRKWAHAPKADVSDAVLPNASLV